MKLLFLTLLLAGAASAAEPTVTIDVKDEDVRVILKTMQKQCRIKNLLIDKDVSGKGMVYFRDVPCETAFRAVFSQFGVTGKIEGNVVSVEPRSR
jgi:type II secretory pathway component GspD/PulD (secretin)